MAAITPATQLDFDQIKKDLITHFKANPTFTDYAFEGSALNTIMDVLAYNTHTNAYYANMLHSESFLDTAQKRNSVISRAKELGYTPRSNVCSSAYVTLEIYGNPSVTPITLTRGSIFSSANDLGEHDFVTPQSELSTYSNGVHTFSNIRIINGALTSNFFKVDTTRNVRSIFTIPNQSIDTTTLRVFVRPSEASNAITEFTKAENVYELKADSTVFFLQESYNEYFQIYFGSNVLGVQPENGYIIEVQYALTDETASANSCSSFSFSPSTYGNSARVTTVQSSFGGSTKEDINSIKYNAIKSNSAKNRAVTASDFSLLIYENFNYVKSNIVWGGEENVPPMYGKVFMALQPVTGLVVSDQLKKDVIIPTMKKYTTLTTSLEIVDPVYTSIETETKVKFDRYKTANNQASVEFLIKTKINEYIDSLSKFGSVYLESTLIGMIMSLDPGIISVEINKKIGFNLDPIIGTSTRFNRIMNNEIVQGTIRTDKFSIYLNGSNMTVELKEVPTVIAPDNFDKEVELALYDEVGTLIMLVGTVKLKTGHFDFNLNVSSYSSVYRYIPVRYVNLTSDFITKHNQIIAQDTVTYGAYAKIDNIVLFESYDSK